VNTDLQQAVVFFGCLIVAVILHEVAHGVVASWFGDDTARRAGRLTLNPLPHIDPVGSIVMPALGALTGVPVLAWAKPVPVNPQRMKDPRRDMVLVGLAGPTTNFLLMAVAAVAARAMFDPRSVPPTFGFSDLPLSVQIVFSFAMVNLFLGLFNLLPIPPLDGSHLVARVLPERWLPTWYRFQPYGILVLFILVFSTGFVSRFLEPFYDHLARFVFG
jgi:Zn-dependent protease